MPLNSYGWFLDGHPGGGGVVPFSTGDTGEGVTSGFTAWDPLDKDPLYTLSVSNTITTSATATRAVGLRTVSGKTRGKHYVEITAGGTVDGNCNIGVTTLGATWQDIHNAHMSCIYHRNNAVYLNGANQSLTPGSWTAGDVICIALDLDNRKVWFRKNNGNWNGSGTANPATNTEGVNLTTLVGYPWFIEAFTHFNLVTSYTGNFGLSAFTYTVPSGFVSGWTENLITNGATWSSGTIVGGITLRNSDYTADGTTASASAFVRSATGKSTGKWCFEYYINDENTGANGVGLCNSSGGISFGTSDGANGVIVKTGAATGSIWVNGVSQVGHSSLAYVNGSIVQIAVDLDADLFWARASQDITEAAATTLGPWNGSALADPATGVGGFDIAALGATLYPAFGCSIGSGLYVGLGSRSITKLDAPTGFEIGWPV